jgi:hypothetical protein
MHGVKPAIAVDVTREKRDLSAPIAMMARVSHGHEHARSKQIKRHARLRDHDLGRPL